MGHEGGLKQKKLTATSSWWWYSCPKNSTPTLTHCTTRCSFTWGCWQIHLCLTYLMSPERWSSKHMQLLLAREMWNFPRLQPRVHRPSLCPEEGEWRRSGRKKNPELCNIFITFDLSMGLLTTGSTNYCQAWFKIYWWRNVDTFFFYTFFCCFYCMIRILLYLLALLVLQPQGFHVCTTSSTH